VLALAAALSGCGSGDGGSATPTGAPAAPTSTSSTTGERSTTSSPVATTAVPSPSPFEGLGAWVDVFDYVPAFAGEPTVVPDDVAAMAARGVRTLYVQTGRDDPRSPGALAHPRLLARFVAAAHDAGMQVVGWYLPTHVDPALDATRVRAITSFREGGGFDGLALDIEWTDGVGDVDERNRRLVELVREAEAAAGARPLGAIVFPPVVLDELNRDLWPRFPWGDLAPSVDVWLPMAYWTFRDAGSPYRDASTYTAANLDRLREHVGDDAVVHVIGGVADRFGPTDVEGFLRAVVARAPEGWSIYDWATLSPDERRTLATGA
jgi:hypothetical protein